MAIIRHVETTPGERVALSKLEKLEVYEKALIRIEGHKKEGRGEYEFVCDIIMHLKNHVGLSFDKSFDNTEKFFPEWHAQKPEQPVNSWWWAPLDYDSRINALKEAIKLTHLIKEEDENISSSSSQHDFGSTESSDSNHGSSNTARSAEDIPGNEHSDKEVARDLESPGGVVTEEVLPAE